MNIIYKYSNNLIVNLKSLNLQHHVNYSSMSPLQKKDHEIKREFESHRNSVLLMNFQLPEYVEKLKQNITPELLSRSTEHIHKISELFLDRKFSFNNRNDAIKFYKEASDYISSVKDDYKRDSSKIMDQYYKEVESTRLKSLQSQYFNNSRKKITILKRKASVPEPTATIKITNIDPLFETSKEYIDSLPTPNLNLDVSVVELEEDVEKGVRSLLNGKLPNEITQNDNIVLGFDCDWSGLSKYLSGIQSKVSIVSLSNGEKTVLFRVCNFGLDKDDLLGQLLFSSNIVKTGFRTHADSNKIRKDYNFLPDNVIDLSYSKEASIALGKQSNAINIDKVAAVLFNVDISRNRSLKLSNWATSQGLSKEQIDSASYNAYYSYKAHFKIPELPSDIISSLNYNINK